MSFNRRWQPTGQRPLDQYEPRSEANRRMYGRSVQRQACGWRLSGLPLDAKPGQTLKSHTPPHIPATATVTATWSQSQQVVTMLPLPLPGRSSRPWSGGHSI